MLFSFGAVTTWKPWDNDGYTEKGALVSLTVVSQHRFLEVLLGYTKPVPGMVDSFSGTPKHWAEMTISPPGRMKRHHDLPNKRTVQKVLRNFDFNSFVRFSTQKIRHLFPPILSVI